MKKIYILLIVLLSFTQLMSQAWLENLPKNKTNYNFYDYQTAFNTYWKNYNVERGYYYENGVKQKAIGWKQFKRWEWMMEGKINPETGAFPTQTAFEVYQNAVQNHIITPLTTAPAWTSIGTSSSTGGYAGIGRVNCIAFHPTNNSTYWIGAPAGGLWKTTNNGSSWTCLTDSNNVLGVSSIVIPSNYATSNTIYIATGDRDHFDNRSLGVLKSTNGGLTWTSTGLTYTISSGIMVNKLIIDPNNNNILLAATSNGVYKTTNGGTTWSNQLTSHNFIDLEYKPNNFNILYGSTKTGKIYVSTNGGSSWSLKLNISSGYRTELAVSPANSNYVYAVIANSNRGLKGVYKSTNSGNSFSSIYSTTNLLSWKSNGSDSGGQGSYDLSLAVSPTNANTVFVGGINTHKSTNGGSAWSCSNCWTAGLYHNLGNHPVVHADKHSLVYRNNGDLFECNDGGVYLSTNNGNTWADKSNGLVISQMYKLGVSQTSSTETITGLQDNGSKLVSNNTWSDVKGGDGMECLIDYTNANIQYATYVKGQITRTTNHWVSDTDIEPSNAGLGAWVTPYIIDPVNHNTLYAGYADVWKTTNKGNSWTKISTMNSSQKLRSMAIAPSNTSVLYVADKNHIWKTTNGGSSWTNITGSLPVTNSSITSIAVKNNNPSTVWISLSGFNSNVVYKSTNGGSSWANYSTGLPSIPAYSIIQDKSSTTSEVLYLGTELGVFIKDGTNSWQAYNTNLPKVRIGELEIYYSTTATNSKLRAATYGRGLWEVSLMATGTTAPVANFGYDAVSICTGDTIEFTDSSTFAPTSWAWTFTPNTVTYVNSTSASSQNPEVKFNSAGIYTVSLTASNTNGSNTKTETNLITVGGIQAPFTESFETNSTTLSSWRISNPDNSKTWSLKATGGNGSSTRSVYMNYFSYNATGQRDLLISPVLNLSNLSTAILQFKHAYTRYSSSSTDSLIIYATNNCGATLTKIASFGESGSGNFATAPNSTYKQTTSFTPATASDWCGSSVGASCNSININSFAGHDNVIIIFQSYNHYGNNLYLDDIQVSGAASTTVSASYSTPSSSLCSGVQTTFTNTSTNATSYVWKQNNVVISTSQNLTKTFTTAGSYQIKLIASNATNSDSTTQTITVNPTVQQAATPSGASSLCSNTANTNYTTTGATNAVSYLWSITPSSAGTISGTSTTGTVNWNSTFSGNANIQVQGVNGCGNGSLSNSFTVSVSGSPFAATTPTGPTSLCINPTNSTYTCSTIQNASTYQWTINPSSAGLLTSTANSVSVDWGNSFTGNATITVKGINTCGSGTTSPALNITIKNTPGAPSTPNGPNSLCKDNGNTNYSVSPVTYATLYNWDLSPSSAGTINGSTASANVNWNNNYVGAATIKVSAANSCGTSSYSNNFAVNINAAPPTPTITQSLDTLYSSAATGNQWYFGYAVLPGATNTYYIANANGIYNVEVTNGNGCKAKSSNFIVNNVSINASLNSNNISIFPNPASNHITVKYDGNENIVLILRNVLGERIIIDEFNQQKDIDLSNISSGVYLVEIHIKDNPSKFISKKIVVE